MTQRIELLLWKYDPQDWNFFWYDPKKGYWIFLIWPTEPNTFFNITQRIEAFVQHDSKNWTLFTKGLKELDPKKIVWFQRQHLLMTLRTEPFFLKKHMTLRIELFFFSKNLRIDPFLPIWLTPRIQAFWTFSYDSKELNTFSWKWFKELNLFSKWLKELNLLLKMTQKFCSLDLTHIFDCDS